MNVRHHNGVRPFPVSGTWFVFLCGLHARILEYMVAKLDDNALMLRYKDGDAQAFESLYSRYRGPLFRFLLRNVSHQATAEDLFQEVWSRVIRSSDSYSPSAKFSTYLFHIARNCTIDHYRRSGTRSTHEEPQTDATPEAVSPSGDPVQAASALDTRALMKQALENLPNEQREVFLLREETGMTLEEIGKVVGASRETIKSRLRYALAKLRAALQSHHGENES